MIKHEMKETEEVSDNFSFRIDDGERILSKG